MNFTIKDIAKLAGVSVSTVSRVINNNYPVSDIARKKVEMVMQENNYRPNGVARSLRSNKTHMIALIIPELPNLFFMRAAKGLEQEMAKRGYSLAIASSGGKAVRERELIEMFMERRIDGLVIASVDSQNRSINYSIGMGVSVVIVDRNVTGVNASKVLWNNIEGSYQLTKFLMKNGHKRIGMINVSLKNQNGQERQEGYFRALKEAGLKIEKSLVSGSNHTVEQAYSCVKEMLMQPTPPTALYCGNGIVLEGALKALEELHLEVYKDISLVAFGNCDCNQFITPKITTAEQDCVEMGKRAGVLLNNLINGKKTEASEIILNTELVVRDSVRNLLLC